PAIGRPLNTSRRKPAPLREPKGAAPARESRQTAKRVWAVHAYAAVAEEAKGAKLFDAADLGGRKWRAAPRNTERRLRSRHPRRTACGSRKQRPPLQTLSHSTTSSFE